MIQREEQRKERKENSVLSRPLSRAFLYRWAFAFFAFIFLMKASPWALIGFA